MALHCHIVFVIRKNNRLDQLRKQSTSVNAAGESFGQKTDKQRRLEDLRGSEQNKNEAGPIFRPNILDSTIELNESRNAVNKVSQGNSDFTFFYMYLK